jgi:transcriptional regulator with XRE-family HTH domain
MTTTRSDMALGELGRQLRELRKSARLTQADLSARAGISRDTLSRVENGGSAETAIVQRVAAELGCQLAIERKPLRAADMRRYYAHLHSDEADE